MNIIHSILLALLISINPNIAKGGNNRVATNNQYFEKEYSIEATEVNLILLTFDEFVRKYDSKESCIIILTKATCIYCQSLLPKYIDVSEDIGIKELYFLDTESMTSDQKRVFAEKFEVTFVPTVFIRNNDETLITEIGDMDIEYIQDNLNKFMRGE